MKAQIKTDDDALALARALIERGVTFKLWARAKSDPRAWTVQVANVDALALFAASRDGAETDAEPTLPME